MYPVSQAFLTAVMAAYRDTALKIHIDTAFESLDLTDEDVVDGSFRYDRSGLSGDTMAPGGVKASDLSVTLLNKGGRYDDVQFSGGLLTAQYGIKTASGDYEWVPLGTFNIDDVSRPTSVITLGAMDNLLLFDVPFSDVGVTFPATNLQILSAMCNHVGVTLKTSSFVNASYTVQTAPDGSLSCRDILSDICEMAAGFARCDYAGALEIVQWHGVGCVQEVDADGGTFAKDSNGHYFDGDTLDGGDFNRWNNKDYDGGVFSEPSPVVSLGPTNRYNFSVDDSPVKVTGIELDADDQTYLVGTDYYAIHISDNKLIQGDPTDALNAMLDVFQDFAFLPFTSDWQGNPALQPGDIIEQVDRNGVHYRTIITESDFAYRGKCSLSAKGASQLNQGYQSQLTKKVSQLQRAIHNKQVQLDSLDQAIVSATSMIAGALGGYFVNGDTLDDEQYHGNVFICDSVGSDPNHPDVTQATKVWRWNLGGFGYSSTGINGPFTTAITANGSIVANLVAAGIVTADMIRSGWLMSKDGSSWIDLDDGSFSFGKGSATYDSFSGFQVFSSDGLMAVTMSGSGCFSVWKRASTSDSWSLVQQLSSDGLGASKLFSVNYPNFYATIGNGPRPQDGAGLFVFDTTNAGTEPFFKVWLDAGGNTVISAKGGNLRFAKDDDDNTNIIPELPGITGNISFRGCSFNFQSGVLTSWSTPGTVSGDLHLAGASGYGDVVLHVSDGVITGWN